MDSSENSIAKQANKYGIIPLKKYGQNFIYDKTLCDKIVRISGLKDSDIALEIGSGPAGLTRSIIDVNPAKFIVIETDNRCIKLLQDLKINYPNLTIIHDDALNIKLADLKITNERVNIIANLPYNIGSKLLTNWLFEINHVKSLTLMLQKEVVDRIIAKPNSKSYGRLSIISQIICNITKEFDVSPKAFYPEPKIWSSIVKLVPKEKTPEIDILQKISEITNLAFSGRRKMIKSSLKNITNDVSSLLKITKLDENLRAENLSPQNYLTLAKYLLRSS